MNAFSFTVKRWWWRKWPPMVRVGWMVSRNARTNVGTAVGVGMIATALVFKQRRPVRLSSTTIPEGEFVYIRVVQNGRTIARS